MSGKHRLNRRRVVWNPDVNRLRRQRFVFAAQAVIPVALAVIGIAVGADATPAMAMAAPTLAELSVPAISLARLSSIPAYSNTLHH